MRTGWSAPVLAGLLVLAACSGQGSDSDTGSGTIASPSTTSPTPSSSTTSPETAATTPAPRPTTAKPTVPKTTTGSASPTTPATALPPALRAHVVTTVPTSRKVVALTFDGGAGSQGASSILATLRAQGVPGSFFVTGAFVSANPGTTRQMAAVGPVGNHSWNHRDFTTLTASDIHDELATTRSALLDATGHDPRPFFRFPFGAVDARTLALVNAEGYGAIGWTTDSLGWKGTSGGMSVDKVVDRVVGARAPGQIVLMHVGANPDDGTTLDAAALPRIISGYRAAGFGFVTLDALR